MNEQQKRRARAAVRHALDRGILIRPQACQGCGKNPLRGSDGRSCLHGHHHRGYDRPLDVEWLCPTCHFKVDRPLGGEKNGNAKLTQAQVDDIRRRYKRGKGRYQYEGSAKRLAREFGLSDRTIRRIITGETWDAALTEGKAHADG